MPAVVLAYPTIADEAANFVHINQQRRPLSKLDLFKAAVASGDSEATQIVDAVAQAGLSIAPHGNFIAWKPGMISNVGGVEASWRQHGAEVTRIALRALGQGFSGQVLRYAGTIFPGIAAVAAEEAKNFKPAFSPKSWDAFVSMIGSKSQEDWRSAVLIARAKDPNLVSGAPSGCSSMPGKMTWAGWDGRTGTGWALSGATPAPAAPPPPLLALLHSRLSLRRSPGRAARCGKAGPRSRPACSSRKGCFAPYHRAPLHPRRGPEGLVPAMRPPRWRRRSSGLQGSLLLFPEERVMTAEWINTGIGLLGWAAAICTPADSVNAMRPCRRRMLDQTAFSQPPRPPPR
jgi:hypothetical protein